MKLHFWSYANIIWFPKVINNLESSNMKDVDFMVLNSCNSIGCVKFAELWIYEIRKRSMSATRLDVEAIKIIFFGAFFSHLIKMNFANHLLQNIFPPRKLRLIILPCHPERGVATNDNWAQTIFALLEGWKIK